MICIYCKTHSALKQVSRLHFTILFDSFGVFFVLYVALPKLNIITVCI